MRLTPILLAAAALLSFASCSGFSRVDATNPTVAELDSLDVQWGLQPRKSRGAPKRSYRYSAPTNSSYQAPSAPAPSAAPSVAPRETVDGPPPSQTLQLDPALR